MIAEWRNQTRNGDRAPKVTKNKAIKISEAARTLQESGVIRIQKLVPSLGAKLKTRSWEHKGWGRALEEIP